MKKLSKISLVQLYKNDIAAREMNMLRGGNNCGCGCYSSSGGLTKSATYEVNWQNNKIDDDSRMCSWEGSGEVTVYGGSTVPENP